jgi:hypothetical protein
MDTNLEAGRLRRAAAYYALPVSAEAQRMARKWLEKHQQ